MKINDFYKSIYSENALRNLQTKFLYLSYDKKIDINRFLTTRLFISILAFSYAILFLKTGFFLAPILFLVAYFLYEYLYLDLKIKKRAKDLETDSIFFFEVLGLTLQGENNLKLCMQITCDAVSNNVMSDEFKKCLNDVKLGKSFSESLNDLMKRIPSKSVSNVLLNIIEANDFGNSISDSLNNQVNYLTDKRILEIKGQINRMPTKISIVSVILFIPLMLILILGPVLINYIAK